MGGLHETRDAAEFLAIEEHVARRFLRVGGQPAILDDLRCDDRNILDSQMHYGMLCNGSVPIAHHPFLMKLPGLVLGFSELRLLEGRRVEARLEIDILFLDELEQIAPQALPTPAVVG